MMYDKATAKVGDVIEIEEKLKVVMNNMQAVYEEIANRLDADEARSHQFTRPLPIAEVERLAVGVATHDSGVFKRLSGGLK